MNWELLWQLALRDLRARYKQSYLGALWVIFQPLSQLVIFTAVFSRHFGAGDSGVPYPLFVLSGLVPWMAVTSAINGGSSSVLNNAQLLKKIYFPRELLPLSTIVAGLVDLALGLIILLFFQLVLFRHWPGPGILFLVPVLIAQTALLTGISFMLAPLLVFVRDLKHVIPTILTLGMFLTPIVYPASQAPRLIQAWLPFNPVSTVISGYRTALFGSPIAPLSDWLVCGTFSVCALLLGWLFLKSSEPVMAEIL